MGVAAAGDIGAFIAQTLTDGARRSPMRPIGDEREAYCSAPVLDHYLVTSRFFGHAGPLITAAA
jgi:hypothetical protein